MASLKELRGRITSVKSTQKITSAMKMVAASKLRRAQEQVEAARPYAARLQAMLSNVAQSVAGQAGAPPLLAGTGKDDVHLLIVMTADRGLCGGFNSNLVRQVRQKIRALEASGKTVKLLPVGRKGRDLLKREHGSKIVDSLEGLGKGSGVAYADLEGVARTVLRLYEEGGFDVATVAFNKFQSAITQIITFQQLVPFPLPEAEEEDAAATDDGPRALYDYEPDEEAILAALLPRNVGVQLFQAALESQASEHGARMTAMDNATRNAGDMIDRLTLTYNRTRQAAITKELIEIISGAEAV